MGDATCLGQLLGLRANHHFYHLPVWFGQKGAKGRFFLLLFEQEGQTLLVDDQALAGWTAVVSAKQVLTKEELLEALSYVPLAALETCQILGLTAFEEATVVKLQQLFPDHKGVASLYQAAQTSLLGQTDPYNPFRYTQTGEKGDLVVTSYSSSAMPDRDYEEELEAFQCHRDGSPRQVSCLYEDTRHKQQVKLYVRGWYLFGAGEPLQVSWKPAHSRHAPWRSSHVAVDKVTGEFFFEGELYRGKRTPIFLKNLEFTSQPSERLKQRWEEFLGIITQQRDEYLLRERKRKG